MSYIHELHNWSEPHWNNEILATPLARIRYQQGFLLGRMSMLGFKVREEASLEILVGNIVKSSAIEGEILDQKQVRSSLAQRLGIDIGGLSMVSRHIEGIVEMMLDATQRYQEPLTKEHLFGWHSLLFPIGRSGLRKIIVGAWRTSQTGAMQVVSGAIGHERVHFEAPVAERLEHEMKVFLDWFNNVQNIDPVLQAGIAHFWFVTIHPFEDGNGRIARAIADMCFARSDGMPERFYSMSSSIEKDRKKYYSMLETCQKGGLDVTNWLQWFLKCLSGAIQSADDALQKVLYKAKIWQQLNQCVINERQRKVIDRLLGNFRGKLTTSKYAKIAKCSQDTALRDIQVLIMYGVMTKIPGGGRSTSYTLNS